MNKHLKSFAKFVVSASLVWSVGGCGNESPGPNPNPNPIDPKPMACGSCAAYEVCSSSGLCAINPSSSWFLAVGSAQIATTKSTGDAWDAFGGAPDPFVMLDARRTSTVQDSFTPTWNEGATYTAGTLLNVGVSVQVLDEDVSANDTIGGPSQLVLKESDLRRGSLTVTNLGQVRTLTFVVQAR